MAVSIPLHLPPPGSWNPHAKRHTAEFKRDAAALVNALPGRTVNEIARGLGALSPAPSRRGGVTSIRCGHARSTALAN